MSEFVLEARDLVRYFKVGGGLLSKAGFVKAVDGVSLQVRAGETFAIVGESGCGKSTLARLLMRLLEPTSGSVKFDGREIAGISGAELKTLRRDLQFVFQDPFSSLNPRMTVGQIVGEPIETHEPLVSVHDRKAKVASLLARVGLRPEHAHRYPHEFSGGQRQRIGIARALASGPKVIIGDEPVSALDVSVQAQVVNLLQDLRDELGLTLVIIAHDLAIIRHMSDRVAVMYLGQIVETGPADSVFAKARHPYTQALLSSIPEPVHGKGGTYVPLKGEIPSPLAPPSGCRFHTRCVFARPACAETVPKLVVAEDGHAVACHFWEEIAETGKGFVPREPLERRPNVERRFELYRKATARVEAANHAVKI